MTIEHIRQGLYYKIRPFVSVLFYILPIKNNKIVFDNFLGGGYGDNPRYIAEELMKRKIKLDIVWLTDDSTGMPSSIRIVPRESLRALFEMSTAKIWIDNVRNNYKPLKKNHQIYLQTWHGCFPAKKIEGEEKKLSQNYISAAKLDGQICDAIVTGGEYCHSIMEHYFWLSDSAERLNVSPPKLDVLFDENYKNKTRKNVRNKLGLDNKDFVVLYAPTFRDYEDTSGYINDFTELRRAFFERYHMNVVIIVRLHPNTKVMNFTGRYIDVTKYPDINELYCITDALVTDYSSVSIEFACIFKKPVFLYMEDYDKYRSEREISSLINNAPFKKNKCFSELIDCILKYKDYREENEYFDNLIYNPGMGAKVCVDWLLSETKKRRGRFLRDD